MSLLRFFTVIKVYVQRSMTYIAVVNAVMLGFLFLDKLKAYGFDFDMRIAAPTVLLCTVVICVFVGYLDQRFGFHREEIKIQMENNPQLLEILSEVKDLKKKLGVDKQ